jgi:hypothetical protein
MLITCIRKSLWAGGQGAKGVALVAIVCWGLNFVTLVVLLALKQLATDEASKVAKPIDE